MQLLPSSFRPSVAHQTPPWSCVLAADSDVDFLRVRCCRRCVEDSTLGNMASMPAQSCSEMHGNLGACALKYLS